TSLRCSTAYQALTVALRLLTLPVRLRKRQLAARDLQVAQIERHLLEVEQIAKSRLIEDIGGTQGCYTLSKDAVDHSGVRRVILLVEPGGVDPDRADIDRANGGHNPRNVAGIELRAVNSAADRSTRDQGAVAVDRSDNGHIAENRVPSSNATAHGAAVDGDIADKAALGQHLTVERSAGVRVAHGDAAQTREVATRACKECADVPLGSDKSGQVVLWFNQTDEIAPADDLTAECAARLHDGGRDHRALVGRGHVDPSKIGRHCGRGAGDRIDADPGRLNDARG